MVEREGHAFLPLGGAGVTYEYRCPGCGCFEVRLPIGTAPESRDCPACRRPARRVFSAPHLARTSPGTAAAREREERSREAPDVVGPPPVRKRRPHPAAARLPRP
nr:zinc ribbon domain-containing protein [Microtetraspora sp. NBRC 13810]